MYRFWRWQPALAAGAVSGGFAVKPAHRRFWVAAALALASGLWLLLALAALSALLAPELRRALWAHWYGLILLWLPSWALLYLGWRRYVWLPAQLLEQAQVLLAAPAAISLTGFAGTPSQALAQLLSQLALQRDQLRREFAAQVAQASARIEQEKNRLAALMAELSQGLIVCNLEGQILLYNQHARAHFATLLAGAELIGIGRSIYAVLDRSLLQHATDSMARRCQRGWHNPVSRFVTNSPDGRLLRVQVAPVYAGAPTSGQRLIDGFVLLLDDISQALAEENQRQQVLRTFTQASRLTLAQMTAALAQLPPPAADLLSLLRQHSNDMARHIAALEQKASSSWQTRWPLEDMLGLDLLLAAQQRIKAQCQRQVAIDGDAPVIWLRLDSYSLVQALVYLAARLIDEFDVRFLRLRLSAAGSVALLDLIWTDQAMSTETVMNWQLDSMDSLAAAGPLSSVSVRDVVARHQGELSFGRQRTRYEAFFRFSLPGIDLPPPAHGLAADQARPEYYDFDLFGASSHARALDDCLLGALSYTVFDTETTGLNPDEGDQIIQIGAVRCVNARLLHQESFEQLINPARLITPSAQAIHGISQQMVQNQPSIEQVLPAFHAFAANSVLVAHNAAFDMKFLQLQADRTGVVFEQPVLDTLLLAAVVQPNQERYDLEAIARRLHISWQKRHSALADALLTAEIWLRLIPLLQAMDIHTLSQARAAAQQTWYARLRY